MIRPSDEEIERVVAELEIGWLQARNHVIQRTQLRERMARERREAISEGIRNLA